MNRCEQAEQYFKEGYTCSQAVVLAFSDLVNINKEELLKLALPLGGGLGRLRLTCGAVSGMALIIGLLFSSNVFDEDNKLYVYSIVQELVKKFIDEKETINCKELLEKAKLEVEIGGIAEKRTEEYYKKRPCGKIVYTAASILENYLLEKHIIWGIDYEKRRNWVIFSCSDSFWNVF